MKELIKPPYGGIRKETFDFIINELLKKEKLTIVEIGMIRSFNPACIYSEGYSTLLFSWLCEKTNSELFSADISSEAVFICEKVLQDYGLFTPKIHLFCNDGLVFLQDWVKQDEPKIDFLYLDAWDWWGTEENKRSVEKNHLESFKIIEGKIINRGLIMIDDVMDETFKGKGKLLIPYLLSIPEKYKLEKLGYQAIFRKLE